MADEGERVSMRLTKAHMRDRVLDKFLELAGCCGAGSCCGPLYLAGQRAVASGLGPVTATTYCENSIVVEGFIIKDLLLVLDSGSSIHLTIHKGLHHSVQG